jgi:hypothetical protein
MRGLASVFTPCKAAIGIVNALLFMAGKTPAVFGDVPLENGPFRRF